MKKIALTIFLALAVVTALVACNRGPVSNNQPAYVGQTGAYTINGVSFSPTAAKNARLEYDGIADLVFSFTVPREHYAHISEECTSLSVTATVADEDGLVLPAALKDVGYIGDERVFEASLGGVFVEDYLTEYSATLVIEFIDEAGRKQSVLTTADSATVYDVAYIEYCDRSDLQSEQYPYNTGEDFSPYADLSTRYAVLSAALRLTRSGTSVHSTYEIGVYQSPYRVEYFDGVLTVAMRNGTEINPNMLKHITVGGKSIYFEIHGGIIRVVLEVST